MKRALLCLALLAGALALVLWFLDRRDAQPVLALTPQAMPAAQQEPEPSAVKLSYVELAASPHRSEQPGATQVYGWVTSGDDQLPVDGGAINVIFEDCATAPTSAAEAHARPDRALDIRLRSARVQEDGGWFVDLPGKCWIVEVVFTPPRQVESVKPPYPWMAIARRATKGTATHPRRSPQQAPVVTSAGLQFDSPGITIQEGALNVFSADLSLSPTEFATPTADRATRRMPIKTRLTIDTPLERDALEITFATTAGIQARGLVFDGPSGEPLPDAHVVLASSSSDGVIAGTGPDGGFELCGIDPEELLPENGMVTFVVIAAGHELGMREVAWERGQTCIPAFKIVLQPSSR